MDHWDIFRFNCNGIGTLQTHTFHNSWKTHKTLFKRIRAIFFLEQQRKANEMKCIYRTHDTRSLTHSFAFCTQEPPSTSIYLIVNKQKRTEKKCTVREQRAYIKLHCCYCYCCCFCAWFLLPFFLFVADCDFYYIFPYSYRIVACSSTLIHAIFVGSVLVYHISYYITVVCKRSSLGVLYILCHCCRPPCFVLFYSLF